MEQRERIWLGCRALTGSGDMAAKSIRTSHHRSEHIRAAKDIDHDQSTHRGVLIQHHLRSPSFRLHHRLERRDPDDNLNGTLYPAISLTGKKVPSEPFGSRPSPTLLRNVRRDFKHLDADIEAKFNMAPTSTFKSPAKM